MINLMYDMSKISVQRAMIPSPLELEKVSAKYDPEKRIAYITYRGDLGADASSAAYQWLNELIQVIGIENLYGEIFDFRDVRTFMPENLIDARKNSRWLNLRLELTFPVAMVVSDTVQHEILRGPMRNVPGNVRKRIVESMEDAHAFLDEWHRQNS